GRADSARPRRSSTGGRTMMSHGRGMALWALPTYPHIVTSNVYSRRRTYTSGLRGSQESSISTILEGRLRVSPPRVTVFTWDFLHTLYSAPDWWRFPYTGDASGIHAAHF